MKLKVKKALLIVDPQNDFCPGGALGVSECDSVVKKANEYMKIFSGRNLPVFVSRDWHPARTGHFKKFGGPWPVHCVQNTKGARFHPALRLPKEAIILSKGMDPDKDSYSAYESFDSNDTPFDTLLKLFGARELYIGGLTTDYCVKYTAINALKAGLKVTVLIDAVRGVDASPGDSEEAIEEMLGRGAKKIILSKFKKF